MPGATTIENAYAAETVIDHVYEPPAPSRSDSSTGEPVTTSGLLDARFQLPLEERVARRAEEDVEEEFEVPVPLLAAGAALSLIGVILLIVGLGWDRSRETSSFIVGGMMMLLGGMVALGFAAKQWIDEVNSQD